ncbi:hypothetical protein ETC01_03535 [Geobacillus sp. NFOSA3]|uniref:hypothetical protein n=1 Tax=Parageobacillus toebii TaxID=153151 RepID=UPI0009BF5C59|nr:hypothetical protein [Parageobacillus toebii]NNU92404.1 hypothetical protein [Geobacillus sp. NFOSA3]OQP02860.1 hypothetical protein B1689_01425 [Geobacillus sp. 44C]MED4969915.1 hypothetical protein [Parageobacillus toebii]MED4989122.1 hypothetical protein [Parageobacillus toebii]QNU34906.1 hypothetical protein IC802_02705 [Geobacillus sp. 44C]
MIGSRKQFAATIVLISLSVMGKAFVLAIIPSLAIATLANIIVSSLVIPVLWRWTIMESEKMPRA